MTLDYRAGSVIVDATIEVEDTATVSDAASRATVMASLSHLASDTSAASAALGVTVTALSLPAAEEVALVPPSPPSAPPDRQAMLELWLWHLVGGTLLLLSALLLAWCCKRKRADARPPASVAAKQMGVEVSSNSAEAITKHDTPAADAIETAAIEAVVDGEEDPFAHLERLQSEQEEIEGSREVATKRRPGSLISAGTLRDPEAFQVATANEPSDREL